MSDVESLGALLGGYSSVDAFRAMDARNGNPARRLAERVIAAGWTPPLPGTDRTSVPEHDVWPQHCRRTSAHEVHVWELTWRRAAPDDDVHSVPAIRRYRCPGVVHDHLLRCCTEHNTHVSPHVGCILR